MQKKKSSLTTNTFKYSVHIMSHPPVYCKWKLCFYPECFVVFCIHTLKVKSRVRVIKRTHVTMTCSIRSISEQCDDLWSSFFFIPAPTYPIMTASMHCMTNNYYVPKPVTQTWPNPHTINFVHYIGTVVGAEDFNNDREMTEHNGIFQSADPVPGSIGAVLPSPGCRSV